MFAVRVVAVCVAAVCVFMLDVKGVTSCIQDASVVVVLIVVAILTRCHRSRRSCCRAIPLKAMALVHVLGVVHLGPLCVQSHSSWQVQLHMAARPTHTGGSAKQRGHRVSNKGCIRLR